MAKATEFETFLKDVMGAFPVKTDAFEDAFKTSAEFSDKLAAVTLEAAEKSADISSAWTQDTIAKLGTVTKAKAEPADYAKDLTDFATAQAEVAAEKMAAFSEVARAVQSQTLELVMASAKAFGDNSAEFVRSTSEEAKKATKKAASAK